MTHAPAARRVCFVVTSDQSAGFLRGYLAHVATLGWDVTLVASDDGILTEFGRREGIRTIPVAMRREPAPVRDLVSLLALVKVVRRVRPHMIVYSTPKAALLASLAGWLGGVPIRVYQLWGLRHETTRGVWRRILRSVERLAGRLSTEVVAVSESLARLAEDEGVADRVVTIGSGSALGVDTRRFSRAAPDLPGLDSSTERFLEVHRELRRVLFVGRVNRDKGVDTLVTALRELATSGRPVACLVVGPDEDDELRAELVAAAADVAVFLIGPVRDPRPYMAAADVLCLPTLREGFGQVIIEAAAMGLPAVTTLATGARDAVVDGRTGLLVPVGDASRLAEALWTVVSDPALAKRLGEAARRRARDEFDTGRVWRLHTEHLGALAAAAEDGPRHRARTNRQVAAGDGGDPCQDPSADWSV